MRTTMRKLLTYTITIHNYRTQKIKPSAQVAYWISHCTKINMTAAYCYYLWMVHCQLIIH